MADRAGGTYTPNRKPRRGRGTGNTPRGSPRGRGGGDNGGESSPSISSTTSPAPAPPTTGQSSKATPSVPATQPTPPVSVTVTPPGLPSEGQKPPLAERASAPKVEPSEPKTTPTAKPKMESPKGKNIGSTSSAEGYSTPSSIKEASTEANKTAEIVPQSPEKFTPVEPSPPSDSGSGSGGSSSTIVPDKPPRRTSQPEILVPKVFEAVPTSPSSPARPLGEAPLTVEIDAKSKSRSPTTEASRSPTVISSRTDSNPPLTQGQVTPASISPGRPYAYGLGGPVGKTGYGLSVGTPGEEDDPWPSVQLKGRRASMADIRKVAKGFTGRQWITLFVFGLADMFSAMIISLQAPFYPPEAEKKGATATEYGLVFGVYELTMFLVSPFFGKFMNRLGPKLVFNLGIILTSTSCICFGLLDKVEDHSTFIALSFVLRITEAAGAAAFVTSSFTIIACEFPESVATTFASLETFFGLGLIIGPTFGGALYQIGGFVLPFAVTGIGLFILAILSSFVMPKIETVSDSDGNTTEGFGIFSILKFPPVLLAALSITISASTLAFLSATLEPHLRQFTLTPVQTGLIFIINGGVYAICAPILGWVCDKFKRPILISGFGAFFILVSFLLIGPAPFVPVDTMLWLVGVGLGIHGVGLAGTFVAGFISALHGAMENGLPDNITTYGVVSGLWTSSLALGAFIGPSMGGFMLDQVGFRNATYFPLGAELFFLVVLAIYLIIRRRIKIEDLESAPLLSAPGGEANDGEVPSCSGYGAIKSD